MTLRATTVLASAFLFLAPAASQATMSNYSQDFETLVLSDPAALSNVGWVVYGNVYSADGATYYYGYGPFPAPNSGGGFSALESGQGGVPQGAQQLSVYSDYNNTDHALGRLIESNVYEEQTIGAADVGTSWTFQFDAKLSNLAGASKAKAFIKTLDPIHGYVTTHLVALDMTSIPATWGTYSMSLSFDASLVGQLLQFGFANTATLYQGSGVYYDNVSWTKNAIVDVAGPSRPGAFELRAAVPNPFPSSTRLDYSIPQAGAVDVGVYDVAGRRVVTLFHGEASAGPHVAIWDGRSADGRLARAGVYLCVLQTPAGRKTQSVVLSR